MPRTDMQSSERNELTAHAIAYMLLSGEAIISKVQYSIDSGIDSEESTIVNFNGRACGDLNKLTRLLRDIPLSQRKLGLLMPKSGPTSVLTTNKPKRKITKTT